MRAARRTSDPRQTVGRRLKRVVTMLAVVTFRLIIDLLPDSHDRTLSHWIANQLNFLVPKMRHRAADHLKLVYGATLSATERVSMTRRVLFNLGCTLTEFMRLAHRRPEDLLRRTRTFGQIHLRRALEAGNGVLLITAHYGSYELAGAYCAAHGLPITVLARARDDVLTEQFVGRIRSQHHIKVIHKTAWREAVKVLREGGLVGVLADQAVNTGGVMADFLGHPASTAVGPILMAQQTGAALLPCFVTRDRNGWLTVELHKPIELPATGDEEADLQTAAQRLNDVLSAQIRHRPEDWQWLHRRWKTPRSIRRRAPKLARAMAVEE